VNGPVNTADWVSPLNVPLIIQLPEGEGFALSYDLERGQEMVSSAVTPPRPPAPPEPLPKELDLTDPEIWQMADFNHRPHEAWTAGGKFLGLYCEKCGHPYPCDVRRALRNSSQDFDD
jgi:hypothetical protein